VKLFKEKTGFRSPQGPLPRPWSGIVADNERQDLTEYDPDPLPWTRLSQSHGHRARRIVTDNAPHRALFVVSTP
jgi:hypothetical protein